MNDKKLAVLLTCFSERNGAGRARCPRGGATRKGESS
jgi:hypothetical protein